MSRCLVMGSIPLPTGGRGNARSDEICSSITSIILFISMHHFCCMYDYRVYLINFFKSQSEDKNYHTTWKCDGPGNKNAHAVI